MIFSVIFFSSAAQETLPGNASWKDSAAFFIKQLKDGAIAVRLHSRSEAIAKLRTMGNEEDAHNIERMQREENKEIIQAFKSELKFCRVYFFFADSTDALIEGRRSGFFVNDSLQVDPAITLREKFFLIAEKGIPVLPQKYDPTQQDPVTKDHGYLTEAIIIVDQNLKQLKKPFPHFANEPFPASLSPSDWNKKVEVLNTKLNSFYKKSL